MAIKLLVMVDQKGGAGSGNFGHTGRPGLRGGSGGSGGGIANGVYPKPAARGLYDATYIPVIDNLSYNFGRENLATNAISAVHDLIDRYGFADDLIGAEVIGGYISDQAHPKDLDVIIEFASDASLMRFLTDIQPVILHSYGRVDLIAWSKHNPTSVEVIGEYRQLTRDRYNTEPVDVGSWVSDDYRL